jgi:hypothetical protein
MSSLNHIATARSEEFSSRVLMLAISAAQMIASEDPSTSDHVVRLDYALRVIRGADEAKMIAAHVVASNPTISASIDQEPTLYGANVPDNDIAYALASIWTARSLAFATAGSPL